MFSFYFLCLYSCLVAGIPESSLSRVEHSIQCMMGPWSIFLSKWTFLDASKSRNEPGWGRAPQFWHKNNWRETSSLLKQKWDPKLWNLSPLATQNMCGVRRAVLVGGKWKHRGSQVCLCFKSTYFLPVPTGRDSCIRDRDELSIVVSSHGESAKPPPCLGIWGVDSKGKLGSCSFIKPGGLMWPPCSPVPR